jgi:antitoxin component YwqK of YwqJK toxin-antitoxin module
MRHFAILLLAVAFASPALAQTDTTFKYFDKGWQECKKDTAHYVAKIVKEGEVWHRRDYWAATGIMQMDATYMDTAFKKSVGQTKWYRENGSLQSSKDYVAGQGVTADFFYESGKKEGHIVYTKNGSQQTGWDESGQEIPNYIVEREAEFPGGAKGWVTYLEQNLNANVAARTRKAGLYTVVVQFIVDKNGKISNVQAREVPEECPRCGKEAIRIIKAGPNWEPAVQHNKKVIYQALQHITFQVIDL